MGLASMQNSYLHKEDKKEWDAILGKDLLSPDQPTVVSKENRDKEDED